MNNAPICPIPKDAKIGDIVVFRDGQRKPLEELRNYWGEYYVMGTHPGRVHESGNNANFRSYCPNTQYDCVGFEYADKRKSNLPAKVEIETGVGTGKFIPLKPVKTQAQKDAKYLRDKAELLFNSLLLSKGGYKRMRQIADRLEKQSCQ